MTTAQSESPTDQQFPRGPVAGYYTLNTVAKLPSHDVYIPPRWALFKVFILRCALFKVYIHGGNRLRRNSAVSPWSGSQGRAGHTSITVTVFFCRTRQYGREEYCVVREQAAREEAECQLEVALEKQFKVIIVEPAWLGDQTLRSANKATSLCTSGL